MAVCHVGEVEARAPCHAAIGSGQMSPLTMDFLSVRP